MTNRDRFLPSLSVEQAAPDWFDKAKVFVEEIEKAISSGVIPESMIRHAGHLIHKLKAKDSTGRWAYYFVLVSSMREKEFLDAIDGDGTIDLEDFGKVVASCYGEEPTPEVRDYLLEKYGFSV